VKQPSIVQAWSDPVCPGCEAIQLDVLIRAGLILAMAMLCYQVFSPFLTLMVWALILAVTIYPRHQSLASLVKSPSQSNTRASSPCSELKHSAF
jgi:hypothetical protein